MFVITVSAVKDIFEDLKRHRADNQENTKQVMRLDRNNREFVMDSWKNLRVGELVKITQDNYFPADIKT
jgi:phospholipid-transporting ATPase